jgi:hypothetical protein
MISKLATADEQTTTEPGGTLNALAQIENRSWLIWKAFRLALSYPIVSAVS